ncbi:MAG: GGDEF domain-containing phosphodiesterase [Pseudomonadota bacterium]
MAEASMETFDRDVLDGFDLLLYRWNLLTDELVWSDTGNSMMKSVGLTAIGAGAQFTGMREDGSARNDWAMRCKPGDTNRFVFSIPTGPATVTWFDDHARRRDINGVPVVTGMIQRVVDPRMLRGSSEAHLQEREGRAMLVDHLRNAGTEQDRAYLLFGIDNLRDLNRALGPDVTDEIVAQVDLRIAASPSERALYARVGSAKFALGAVGSGSQALAVLARKVMDRVGRNEIRTTAGPVTVSVSAGICHCQRGTTLPSDPYANALIAYDEARVGRIEGLRFSRDGNGSANLREHYVTGARLVMDAIADGRLTLALQPIVRADNTQTVAFQECLARIIDSDGEPLPAASFMPAIEHLGLIRQVDREVLRGALDLLENKVHQRLSVNLSPQSMNDSEWLSILEGRMEQAPDIGDRLIFEITESSAMLDPSRTLAFMNRVRTYGCAFALDDFGAGYTSFRHFRDFRFDAVKIDGSFIGGIAHNDDNQLLLRTLVSIARHFSMFTVAEFVEAPEDAAYLRDLGIDCLQGYLFGRPALVDAGVTQATRLRA